jgi:hypothetical protein
MTVEAPRTVRVWCRAQHPDRAYRTGECANLLGDIPAGYRFVETAPTRPPANGDGRMWVQCSRAACKAWNVFEKGGE